MNVEPGMRPWRYDGPAPDSWFCHDGVDCLVDPNNPYQASGVQSMIDREMQLAAQLGVATIRVEFDWPLIETANAAFDFSRTDYMVQEANRYHIQLQPVLVYTPKWASSAPGWNMWYATYPANDQYWTDFLTQIVGRYKNSIHYWEIWNEPDGGGYWWSNTNPGAQQFVDHILNPGYQAIKAVDPTAKVIVGPDHADTTWYSTIVSDGGGNSFDIAAFHDYSNTALSGVQSMQSWLNSNGMGSKPIWIGEYGYSESSNTTSDTNQQSLMTAVLQGSGYQQAQWYTLRDELPRSCCPLSGTEGRFFGIVEHDDVTLKNGFTTMKNLIARMSGSATATPLPTGAPTASSTRVPPNPSPTAVSTAAPSKTAVPTATPTAKPTSPTSRTVRFSVMAAKVEWGSSHLDLSLKRASLARVTVRKQVKLTTYVDVRTAGRALPIREEVRVTLKGRTVFYKRMSGTIKKSQHGIFAFWAFFAPPKPGIYSFTGTVSNGSTYKQKTRTFSAVAG